MKKLYMLLALSMASSTWAGAQIVTSEPSPLQENSEDVIITYHADQGNKGLMGLTESTPIYAHTGVITNKSNGSWVYAPSWLDNDPKYQLFYVGPNTWELEIGDIREFYGIEDPDEVVEKLAFVFRTKDGSSEGKTATGQDIFIDVLPDGFHMQFSSDSPLVLNSETSTVTFTAVTTLPSDISIFINDAPIASASNQSELTASYTFAQGASYDVIAVAKRGSDVLTQSITVCYPPNSTEAAYPGGTPKMGAVAAPNGDVTFCIAAPLKRNAMIVPSWDGYQALAKNVMHYTDVDGIRYFWITVKGLDPATDYPYYYLIDESIKVGDPYARLVLDPYSDKWLSDGTYPGLIPYPHNEIDGNVMLAVYNGSRDKYDWKVTDFTPVPDDQLIVYELLIRDFTGTEGKAYGDGTLRKAMEKMDYLQTLGVNAIELLPIQEFNGNNSWGYNTNFYFAPDKAYGSPDDYRAFIDECHSRGMAVILDVVFNQSDGLHPWYQMYPSGSNPFYNARAPHAYSVLNDWLQDNLLVQQQWTDMLRYWMQAYKVDGFRFDLVKGLGDNASYGGNASDANTNRYNASRVARMKKLTEVIKSINPAAYSINENLAGAKEENEMAANGSLNWANINNPACQFAMGYKSDSDCNRFYAPRDSRTWGSTVSYAESHDEQRMAYKQDQWGVDGVKGNLDMSMRRLGSVAAQMLLSPGAHMIWQFGELGNATSTKNPDGGNNTDPKPVLWNYLDVPARHGLYQNYCDLIGIRRCNPDLFALDASFSIACNTSAWDNGRFIYASTTTKEILCVINPTMTPRTFNAAFKSGDNSRYHIAAQSYDTTPTFDASRGTVTLEPGAFVVIANDHVSGIDHVTVDASDTTGNAPAVYYNLQGICVANPTSGIYIRVCGGNTSKVLLR